MVILQIFLYGGRRMGMLQDRINELDSAIVNVVGNFVSTMGFYNTDRLMSYLEGKKNWSSIEKYPFEALTFHNIKTNATIIFQQDGIDIARYKYIRVKNGSLIYENQQNKSGKATAVYEIRKEIYSSIWNLRFADSSQSFKTWEDMQKHILSTYKYDIGEELFDEESLTS